MIFRSLLLLGASVAALQSVIEVSGAKALAAGETQALALDFTDDFFHATTGFYGSAYVLDTTTPANNYNSSPTQTASSLLTYTSPSLKLTRGPAGTLRFGPLNLYQNSASPANQSITVESGAAYTITITGTVSVTASGAATGTWTAGSHDFTAASGTLTLGSTSGAGTVRLRRTPSDDLYLETAGAARVELPYEWDTAGNLIGIRSEGAQTNVLINSDDLTGWSLTRLTVTANQAVGPTGLTDLEKLVEDSTANTTHAAARTISGVTSGTQYHFSVYARAGEWPGIGLRFRATEFPTGQAIFDLVNGTVSTTGTLDDAYMVDYGGGLWRCVIVATATATASSTGTINIASASSITLSGENGTKGIFAGSVMAGTGHPGTHVPTRSATVTRAADNITLPVASFPYNPTEGTIFVQARTPRRQDGIVRYLFSLDDGSENNRILAYRNASNAMFVDVATGGVQQAAINIGSIAPNTDFKLAIRYRADDIAVSLNGGAVGTDTSATIPTVTTLRIGRRFSTNEWNGTVAKMLVVGRGMSDAELQSLSTP